MKLSCRECTLTRECIDGVCEECRGNMPITLADRLPNGFWPYAAMLPRFDPGGPEGTCPGADRIAMKRTSPEKAHLSRPDPPPDNIALGARIYRLWTEHGWDPEFWDNFYKADTSQPELPPDRIAIDPYAGLDR